MIYENIKTSFNNNSNMYQQEIRKNKGVTCIILVFQFLIPGYAAKI